MIVKVGKFTMYSGDDTRGKWELKYYWQDGVTVECRYFARMKEAKAYAESEGIPEEDYSIVPHRI